MRRRPIPWRLLSTRRLRRRPNRAPAAARCRRLPSSRPRDLPRTRAHRRQSSRPCQTHAVRRCANGLTRCAAQQVWAGAARSKRCSRRTQTLLRPMRYSRVARPRSNKSKDECVAMRATPYRSGPPPPCTAPPPGLSTPLHARPRAGCAVVRNQQSNKKGSRAFACFEARAYCFRSSLSHPTPLQTSRQPPPVLLSSSSPSGRRRWRAFRREPAI